jgi:DNA-binding NarL/FixJ family response regulator
LPVIIFSGHADPEDLQMGIALGADAYLSKPAKVEAILAAVKGVLGG